LVVGQWNDCKISGAGDLIAGLRLIEVEGYDVGVAIADIAAKHFNQCRVDEGRLKKAEWLARLA
jgi:hypothetical protein